MTDTGDPASNHDPSADADRLRRLAQDWLTLWQDELTAIARDPETMRSWQAIQALWAGAAASVMRGVGPDDAARPPPAAAAHDARDAEIERLHGQLRDMESRLAELERSNSARHAQPPRRKGRVSPRRPA